MTLDRFELSKPPTFLGWEGFIGQANYSNIHSHALLNVAPSKDAEQNCRCSA
jgi:hypothetical protein